MTTALSAESHSAYKAQDARRSRLTPDQLFEIDLDKALCVLLGLQSCDTWAVFEAMLCSIYSHIFCLVQMLLIVID